MDQYEQRIIDFLKSFHLPCHNVELYKKAFTHSSYNVFNSGTHYDYERIEFIGDAVIEFYVSDNLFKLFPTSSEGEMTRIRAYLVKSKSLASYSRKLNLETFVVTSYSIKAESIVHSDNILEDIFESLVGAIYLDSGIDCAFKFMNQIMLEDLKNIDLSLTIDAKTKLQELMQAEYHEMVHYEVVETSGPAHDRTFKVNVMFNDVVLASGIGKSKKAAEEEAALNALKKGVM